MLKVLARTLRKEKKLEEAKESLFTDDMIPSPPPDPLQFLSVALTVLELDLRTRLAWNSAILLPGVLGLKACATAVPLQPLLLMV